jgi:hypothetical protein
MRPNAQLYWMVEASLGVSIAEGFKVRFNPVADEASSNSFHLVRA